MGRKYKIPLRERRLKSSKSRRRKKERRKLGNNKLTKNSMAQESKVPVVHIIHPDKPNIYKVYEFPVHPGSTKMAKVDGW